MISVITRVQYPDLHDRMWRSAVKNAASDSVEFLTDGNASGQPNITASYNKLGAKAAGDILVFCHDDIEFIEPGWDARLEEFFAQDFDIGGVIGVDRYEGDLLVSLGHPHCFGKFINRAGDEMRVNIYGPHAPNKQLVAVDGMFMAVRASHFAGHKFDETLDGLFFYDIDYCLRGRVGLLDLMVAHWKPKDRFGVYPVDMNSMSHYEPYFYGKHKINPSRRIGDTRALCATQKDYQEQGHDALWALFERKYLVNV